jgi:hypothetical protein
MSAGYSESGTDMTVPFSKNLYPVLAKTRSLMSPVLSTGEGHRFARNGSTRSGFFKPLPRWRWKVRARKEREAKWRTTK